MLLFLLILALKNLNVMFYNCFNNPIFDPFPTNNFKEYSNKTNPKITILEILVYKI